MQINMSDASGVSGFYATGFEIFAQTLSESEITTSFEMGGGIAIHHGTRNGDPIWLMDNPMGKLYGIWVEEKDGHFAN